MQHQNPGGSRIANIDAMRGLAACLVIILHASETLVAAGAAPWSLAFHESARSIHLGHIGVVLFFAISGYVIPQSLHGEKAAGTRRFLVRRFFRLFPAFWTSAFAMLALALLIGKEQPAGDFLANLTMLSGYFGIPDVIGVYWTLRVELAFYFLCWLMFMGNRLKTPRWIAAGICILFAAYLLGTLSTHWLQWPGLMKNLPTNMLNIAIMFWGALFRQHRDGQGLGTFDRLVLLGFFVGMAIVGPLLLGAATYLAPDTGLNLIPRLQSIIPYALAGIIFAIGATSRWQMAGPFRWLGEISYSLYLFHPIVLLALLALLGGGETAGLGNLPLGAGIGLVLALSIAVAAVVYHFVESPMIALGRRISAKL